MEPEFQPPQFDTGGCAMNPLTALLDSSQALPDASCLPSFLSCGCVAYYDKTSPPKVTK